MATVTLASLRSQVRQRADMVNRKFCSDAEINGYINQCAAELYDKLVAANEDYYSIKTNVTVSSPSSSIPLPANTYKVRGLDVTQDNYSTFATVWPYEFLERGAYFDPNVRQNIADVRYHISADSIDLLPESSAPGNYRLWTVPLMPQLVSDSDTFVALNGFEQYIVIAAAIICMTKEESDTTALERALARQEKRINDMRGRDQGGPESVADVRRSWEFQ